MNRWPPSSDRRSAGSSPWPCGCVAGSARSSRRSMAWTSWRRPCPGWRWRPGRSGRCSGDRGSIVDDGSVHLVNVVRTIDVPWPAIQSGRHQVGADPGDRLRPVHRLGRAGTGRHGCRPPIAQGRSPGVPGRHHQRVGHPAGRPARHAVRVGRVGRSAPAGKSCATPATSTIRGWSSPPCRCACTG